MAYPTAWLAYNNFASNCKAVESAIAKKGALHVIPLKSSPVSKVCNMCSVAICPLLQGLHIAHVNIDGMVELPRTKAMKPDAPDGFFLKPAAIADSYWALHEQDSSAWTHELDLRPAIEKW